MSNLKFDVVQTAGIINVDFESIESQLSEKMDEYNGLVFTEDKKKDAKADLAELRKYRKAVNDRKSEVKKAYMEPYNQFEAKVKKLIELIDEPINYIDGQVKEFEEKRIREKKAEIKKIYDEIVPEDLQDYIPLECIYGTKWDNASTTMKSIKQEISDAVSKAESDISVIKGMNSDKTEDALNLYMSTRNLAVAIKFINDYEAKKREILERQAKEKEKREAALKQEEIDRIRREERARIAAEERIRQDAKKEAVEELKTVDEQAARPLSSADSKKVIYTVVATDDELQEIEMALTSLGVYFDRKDV